MIPVEAATKAGVLVANVPGVNARTVAEHVFMVSLALLRQFRQVDRDLRAKGWLAGRDHADSRQRSRRAGRSASSASALSGAQVADDRPARLRPRRDRQQPNAARSADRRPVRRRSTNWSSESDIVVLCCPLTPETTRPDRAASASRRMKPDALLINVSRGPVVEDDGADRGAARRPDRRRCARRLRRRSRCRRTIPISASTT